MQQSTAARVATTSAADAVTASWRLPCREHLPTWHPLETNARGQPTGVVSLDCSCSVVVVVVVVVVVYVVVYVVVHVVVVVCVVVVCVWSLSCVG